MADAQTPIPNRSLRPKARILRTLGQELISSEVVAIIELVKNAYDADASRVLIRFKPPLEPGAGLIEVIDNGSGMTLATVQTVYMEPATASKRERQRSEKFGRRFLGAKGIGRFSAARLAEELEVISRREGAANESYALFDWRQFDDDQKYLDEIEVLWDERKAVEITPSGPAGSVWRESEDQVPYHELQHGTVLRMASLRQLWGVKQFEDLTRGLARLIAPAVGTTPFDIGSSFEIALDLPDKFSRFGKRVEPPAILKHPHYTVSGSVSSSGEYDFRVRVLSSGADDQERGKFIRVPDRAGKPEVRAIEVDVASLPSNAKPIECGPITFEFRVWDRDDVGNVIQKTNSTITDVRRDLNAVAGVNIYRDGFRVLPYGEPQDDWLRLDLRRVQNPTLRLSNNQIYGVVSISADDNPSLRDQSNREGLDENQALEDLRQILTIVLGKLETRRYAVRPRRGAKTSKPAGGLFGGFDFKPLTDHIANRYPEDQQSKDLIRKTEIQFGEQLKEIQTVLSRYQRLATLGQLIDHVLHEGRQPIAAINNEAYLGKSDIEKLGPTLAKDVQTLFSDRFSLIRKQGDVLSIAFKRMEPFGGRRRGRPAKLYLEDVIRDGFAIFRDDVNRLGVKASLPNGQTLVRVDPAELQEVIINLTQNSLYWLEQVDESSRDIAISVERKSPEQVDILFSDSGPGVPPENHELIFEPYFSTRSEGVGLGLSIVGEIVTDYYDGSLELLSEGLLGGATFRVTLKKRV